MSCLVNSLCFCLIVYHYYVNKCKMKVNSCCNSYCSCCKCCKCCHCCELESIELTNDTKNEIEKGTDKDTIPASIQPYEP